MREEPGVGEPGVIGFGARIAGGSGLRRGGESARAADDGVAAVPRTFRGAGEDGERIDDGGGT
ncbi:MAG: hypothetical protein AAB968_04710 [Patescibacteria group bacterium]